MQSFVNEYLSEFINQDLNILDIGGRVAVKNQDSYFKLFNKSN